MKIELGDKVKHRYSGFEGTATARTHYISGCDRINISPKVKKDGTLGDTLSFDEPEVDIVKKNKIKKPKVKTGGWQPNVKHYLKDN